MSCDFAPAHIRAIAPYEPGKPISELAREMGLEEASIIKLASNENPRGVSPFAQRAISRVLDDLGRYPDGNGFELKRALERRYGVPADSIVLGNGSNDVLDLAARAFLTAADEAIYSQHAFAVYPLAVQGIGARGIEIPARNFGHDLDAMRTAITAKTRVIFIANPNNPTGTFLRGDALESFLARVPEHTVIVLDEAYNEYLPLEVRTDTLAWLKRFPNLVITRTFSKVYGLAGLRVGYAFASRAVADLMNRVREPFNVNSMALAAAAAALDDTEFVRESYELNRRGMAQVVEGLGKLRLEHIPSFGNFVTFKVANAREVFQRLLKAGVIVRPLAGYGMPEHLRVTIGLESENARFLESLARDPMTRAPTSKPRIGKLVVVGVGLIGGSFALALKKAKAVRKVVGVGRSRKNLNEALKRGIVDEISRDAADAVADADLVLIATPVGQMPQVMAEIAPGLSPNAIVTDGGSTKQDVIAYARRFLAGHFERFVPAHPIAGTEKSGATAAFAELYRDRNVILAPLKETKVSAVKTVRSAWQACGARVVELHPRRHDQIFAAVSHLPHVAAFALMSMLAKRRDAQTLLGFSAGGLRDTVRIAGSSPEMWRDICVANRAELTALIDDYVEELEIARGAIENADPDALTEIFERARDARARWLVK